MNNSVGFLVIGSSVLLRKPPEAMKSGRLLLKYNIMQQNSIGIEKWQVEDDEKIEHQ